MIYVPIHISTAAELNRQLYKLTQPDNIRNPDNITEFYCGMYEHPLIPFAILELPEEDTIPIHLAANTNGLISVLSPFVAQNQITQAELDIIVNNISILGGQRFAPSSMIPQSWQQYVLTREQAIEQGYIQTLE